MLAEFIATVAVLSCWCVFSVTYSRIVLPVLCPLVYLVFLMLGKQYIFLNMLNLNPHKIQAPEQHMK
jgi:hypothetical protein